MYCIKIEKMGPLFFIRHEFKKKFEDLSGHTLPAAANQPVLQLTLSAQAFREVAGLRQSLQDTA